VRNIDAMIAVYCRITALVGILTLAGALAFATAQPRLLQNTASPVGAARPSSDR